MILIGGGFSEESLKRIARQVGRQSQRIDMDKYCKHILEVVRKIGRREREETIIVKDNVLTPDQEIEVEALRQRIKAILNSPPEVWNLH
jgi:sulfite reductase beta subunit-like hemoprotein